MESGEEDGLFLDDLEKDAQDESNKEIPLGGSWMRRGLIPGWDSTWQVEGGLI